MRELVPSSGGNRRSDAHFSTLRRGETLLAELDRTLQALRERFPDVPMVLEDPYGVPVRALGGAAEGERNTFAWHCIPLTLNGRWFGCIRCAGPMVTLGSADVAPIVLMLSELERWLQTEGERRGEKIQKLLAEGVTAEVEHLLTLCGLPAASAYTLVGLELAAGPDRFLYMDVLRMFMLVRMWRYRPTMDFVAFRSGGLVGIFPDSAAEAWERQLEMWMGEWQTYQAHAGMQPPLAVRGCVTSVATVHELDQAVRDIDATLQFAERACVTGVVRPRRHSGLTSLLLQLSEEQVYEWVYRTLGPILALEHADLLKTLRLYLLLNQNVTHAAKALFIHRNTLMYRLKHIEELLGMNLRNTAELSTVWAALEGLELLSSRGHPL
ncbi:PucR family transcriptional regulator [Alicyclobacillus contaminans]|uniref:PucR family transcriptional regulator n=1 Tax=Alicyclobacillus contaminans TaxID=392016 RepID=UPI0003FB0CCC|nr:helix-turn-helix domain-containing protein [Alicyclobacillus contaminans]